MTDLSTDIREQLRRHRQEHVLAGWDALSEPECERLAAQVSSIDFQLLARLYARRNEPKALPDLNRVKPLPVQPPDAGKEEVRLFGEAALARGEVAVLMVAGGQGTRLRCDQPKGMFEIG